MSFIIQIQNVSKIYTEKGTSVQVKALDQVNLNIEQGDFMALAGPSGSGKTTLLNMIGALDIPTNGEVLVDGILLKDQSTNELADFRLRRIGFVFQAYNLINTLTVHENAEYVAFIQGRPWKERVQETKRVLEDLGLGTMSRRRPRELSAGQQQRVAIARALLAHPKIILADEPTANLDSATGAELLELMHQINMNMGVTFVFATHDPRVMDRAKTLIRLQDGKIAAC
jgi:putative ABC transport system ATP-binding protein